MALTLACAAAWTQPGTAPPEPAGPALSSPRATVGEFLDAMNAVQAGKTERLADALACLYLDAADEVSGPELAQQLYEIIDHFTLKLDSIPETVEERSYDIELKKVENGGPGDTVVLALRRYDDGSWRFHSSTIAQLPDLYASILAQPVEPVETKVVNPKLRSPRATMRTFIEGMNRWDEGGREDALSALDLTDIPAQVRESEGALLADQLKQILDRDKKVLYQEIPDDPDAEPYVHLANPKGDIVIVPVEREGMTEWRFSTATLASLRGLYDEYKDRGTAEGVEDTLPKVLSQRLRKQVGDRFPFLLRHGVFLENWQWLGLFIIILVGMAAGRALTFALILAVRHRFQHEHLSLDKRFERDFVRPIRIALMAWVWLLGLRLLGLPATVLLVLYTGAKTITVASVAWAAYRLIDILGQYLGQKARRTENKFDDILVPLVVRSFKVLVVVFGVVFVADTLDINIRAVVAGLGLGGLAFALAAKDTVANLFGSLTIILDRPFQIGDWVIVGSAEGSVESVGIRSTRIRTFYNSLIAVPNSEIVSATIDNMGARRYRRIKMMIGVTYDTPPGKIEAFCEGIRHLIRIHPYTRKDYYHVWFNGFADSSLNILLYCFLETPEWGTELRERHRLLLDIIRLADRLGVSFAFPTRTLYMQSADLVSGAQPDVPGTSTPPSADDAVAMGRRAAFGIMEETLGPNAPPPPPVSYTMPGDADITSDDAE